MLTFIFVNLLPTNYCPNIFMIHHVLIIYLYISYNLFLRSTYYICICAISLQMPLFSYIGILLTQNSKMSYFLKSYPFVCFVLFCWRAFLSSSMSSHRRRGNYIMWMPQKQNSCQLSMKFILLIIIQHPFLSFSIFVLLSNQSYIVITLLIVLCYRPIKQIHLKKLKYSAQ